MTCEDVSSDLLPNPRKQSQLRITGSVDQIVKITRHLLIDIIKTETAWKNNKSGDQ